MAQKEHWLRELIFICLSMCVYMKKRGENGGENIIRVGERIQKK